MSKRLSILFVLALVLLSVPAFAGPVPSKTADLQSLESREADLSSIRNVAAQEEVAKVLAEHGFTQEEVNQRLAEMSDQDLQQLSQNLDQLQAAGLTRQEWIWILIGAVAALVLIIALS